MSTKKTTNPKENASFLSHLFLCWVSSLVKIGSKRKLTQDDLFELSEEDRAGTIVQDFEQVWEDEITNARVNDKQPKLWKAMIKYFDFEDYLRLLFLIILETVSIFCKPVLLWFFLILLTTSEGQFHDRHAYYISFTLGGIAVANFVQAFSQHHNTFVAKMMGMRIDVGCTGLIYRKVLKSSRYCLSKETSGHVFNLVSNDIQRIRIIAENAQYTLSFVIVGPTAFALLCILVQWQTIFGAIFVIVCGILQVIVSMGYAHYQTRQALATDERLSVENEVIKGIRTVKMHAWEWHYLDAIRKLRRKETKLAQTKSFFLSIIGVVQFILYAFGVGISIFTLLYLGFRLDIVRLFVLMSIITHLTDSIIRQILCTLHSYNSYTAIKRIETFLLAKETDPAKALEENSFSRYDEMKNSTSQPSRLTSILAKQKKGYSVLPTEEPAPAHNASICVDKQDVPCLKISDLKSGWKHDSATLHAISLHISSNMLVMITGPVGSGKTTLLMTILREIFILSGELTITGKIAYVSQISWVFTGTVRENILFGLPFDAVRYQRVLEVCDLNPDINGLPKGDLSMIGQRGVMLSGGQRARVSLARAVYSEADILLLDDPLSAVDANVGEHLFEKCICGNLVDKIRILVTHQLQHLHRADKVIVLKEGRVVGQGPYEEISKDQRIYHLIADYRDAMAANKKSTPFSVETKTNDELDKEQGIDLTEEDEDGEDFSVSLSLYWKYLTSGLRSWLLVCLFLYFLFAAAFPYVFFWWLREMALMSFDEQRSSFTLGIFGGILAGSIIFPFLQIWLLMLVLLQSAVTLNDKMTIAVLKSPLLFFDKNPVGRIINRFSKDIGVLDDELPITFVFGSCTFVPFFVVIGFLVMVDYWFLLVTIPALVVFVLICWYYLRPVRDLSRLEALLCSPVYDHVSETMEGLEVIHTSNMEQKNLLKLYRLQNLHTKAFSLSIAMERAIGLYIELVCAMFISLIIIGSVVLRLHPATCGMMYLACMTIMRIAAYGVQMMTQVETLMVSVERVKKYTELPSEPGYDRSGQSPTKWPNQGAICIQGLSLKYLEGGANVLSDINFEIKPSERIGIAGRTGAGKTSLVAALLRMPDPEGQVIIDGVDLATLNIQVARCSMAVISQNPILFSGSLQHSLDPFSHFADEQIWYALDVVQMKERVSKLEGSLKHMIGDGGSGFSVGETQLLCLARALLQKCKILILDEATANVDYKTDQLVQQVIREKFANCTVLTIAHRLNTIMDYDRIVVMEQGHVVEFDSPAALAAKPNGVFAKLVHGQ